MDITNTLKEIGIPLNLKGHTFLVTAIEMVIEDDSIIYDKRVTKELYPSIAKKYNTTYSRVERAIRHAVQTSFDRGNIVLLNKLFSYTVDYNKGAATNSEFIATLADYFKKTNSKGV